MGGVETQAEHPAGTALGLCAPDLQSSMAALERKVILLFTL